MYNQLDYIAPLLFALCCCFLYIAKPNRTFLRVQLGPTWRRGRDSNPRYVLAYARFPSVCLRPLNHLSVRPNALQQKRFYHKYAKKAIVFRYVFPNSGGKFLSRRRGHLSLRIRTALYAATACIAPARGVLFPLRQDRYRRKRKTAAAYGKSGCGKIRSRSAP